MDINLFKLERMKEKMLEKINVFEQISERSNQLVQNIFSYRQNIFDFNSEKITKEIHLLQ